MRCDNIGLVPVVLVIALLEGSTPANAQVRPNVVFLMSDDHAGHAISAYQNHLKYGAHLPRTPNLDRLARDGMLFVNSFVTNSICGPARATVLTGQYGHLNGVMTNTEPLHPTTVTFPRAAHSRRLLPNQSFHFSEQPRELDRLSVVVVAAGLQRPVAVCRHLYLRSYPNPSSKVQISTGGGRDPTWSADGTRIFYMAGTVGMSATLSFSPNARVVARDTALKETSGLVGGGGGYTVAKDGRFLGLALKKDDYQLVVVPSWRAELAQRLGGRAKR